MNPGVYNKYTIEIVPPVIYQDGEVVKQDVVLAKDLTKAIEIMENTYGSKGNKLYKLVSCVEVTLFGDYQAIGEE